MKMKNVGVIAALSALPLLAQPNVESREYKLMLDPSLFTGSNPSTAITNFWDTLENLIETNMGRSASGSFSLDKSRTVRFYDTPESCVLKNSGFVFRERVENTNREVTLKFRSPDRYISGYQNMSASSSSAETKFEEDISAPFVSKYSYSTTQGISSSKNLNKMDDPVGLYPGLEAYGFDEDEAISLVGNLEISERVYKGTDVDLGNKDGQFSLTLWYRSGFLTTPVVAEISFKYADSSEDYSEHVVTRAKAVFEQMQSMSAWVATEAITKTAYVYAYNPSYCQ
jgi:hypothetical protein